MRIVFCHMGAESLGLEYLSAALKSRGHEVFMAFDPMLFNDKYYLHINFLSKLFNKRKKIFKKIVGLKPDIVGFMVLTDTYKWASSFAQEIKHKLPNTHIIFGGPHPTSVPDNVIRNRFIDSICIGEGDEALVEFVENPERRDIKNFWFKDNGKIIKNSVRPLIQDMDSLPFPDKSLFEKYISIKDTYLIAANRGCPFSCTYCFNNYFNSLYRGQKTVRQRSVGNVIQELAEAKKKYKPRSIYFVDDVFSTNMGYLREFFEEYNKHIRLPFKIISHPAVINDEMIKLFKKSGCFNIEIGIQSMCQETRKNILKRYESNETIIKAVNILEENKIPYTLHHIFGLPNDDYQKLLDAANFYYKLKYCTKIDCYWLSYFPKTEIVEIAKKHGLIADKDIENIENGEEPMYFEGGSVRNKKLKKLCKNFDLFFQLIPSLPHSWNAFIFRKRLFNYFYLLPNFSIVIFNLANAVKNKDLRTFDYIRHYFNHIIRFRRL